MRKLLACLAALILSSSAFASDTFGSFNPGPSGPVQSNGTYKLVPFTGCSAGVPLLSWTGACVVGVTVPVTVPQGGTGVTTLTTHGILLGEGTGNVVATAALAADNLLLGQGVTSDPAAVALVNCGDATHALAYSTSTHTFSCQTISASTSPGGSTTQVQFNLAGAFQGDAGFTYTGSATQAITFGTTAVGPSLNAAASSAAGRTFTVTGSSGASGNDGGPINLTGGAAGTSGTGGALSFAGGAGNGSGTGGAAAWKGGNGGPTGNGGVGTVSGGGATTGTGGVGSVTGGNVATSGVGGAVTLTAGTSAGTNMAGANINLQAGAATGSGAPGGVLVTGTGAYLSFASPITPSTGRAVNTGTTADTAAAGIASIYESANTAAGPFTVTLAAPTRDGERRRVCFKNATGTVTWTVTSPATAVAGIPITFIAGQCTEMVYNSASGTPANAPATTWLVY